MEKKQYIQPNAKLIEIEAEPCLQSTSTIVTPIDTDPDPEGAENNENADGF